MKIRRDRTPAPAPADPTPDSAASIAATPVDTATTTSGTTAAAAGQSDVEAARYLAEAYQHLQHEIAKVIVGQERVIEEILIAVFARGHCVMQGVPGLAKTLLVS